MRHFKLSHLLVAAGLGLGVGYGVILLLADKKVPDHAANTAVVTPTWPRALDESTPSITGQVIQSPAANEDVTMLTTESVANLSVEQLVSHLAKGGMTSLGVVSFVRLRELARSDPAALRGIISRYEAEPSGATKDALRGVLATQSATEVADLARRLALGNAAQRKEAYELFSSMADSGVARAASLQALSTEHDPALLSQAIKSIRPTRDPEQSQTTLVKLSELAQNVDPTVRGASLQALAQIDKTGREAEPSVYLGLKDQQPAVRSAALYAVMYNGQLNSERLKSELMSILSSPGDSGDKSLAMQGLERFTLNPAEYVTYNQAIAQLNKR